VRIDTFVASSKEATEEANQHAKIPFLEVVEVMEITPEPV
jgi:hypothetical protein